jgi:hypothetical protein
MKPSPKEPILYKMDKLIKVYQTRVNNTNVELQIKDMII